MTGSLNVGWFERGFAVPDTNWFCGNSRHGCTWGYVPRDHGIRSYRRSVTDGDASKNGNAPSNPNFFSQHNWARKVACISDGNAIFAAMIRIPDATVFPDHGTAADGYSSHGNQMNTP